MEIKIETNVETEPARIFYIHNSESFASISLKYQTVPINSSGLILINEFKFEKVLILICRVTYGNDYCDSYYTNMDLEPDLIQCIEKETGKCILTIFKPTRIRISDPKILEYQLEEKKMGLFEYVEIDKIITNNLESYFGKIKSKTNETKTILSSIVINIQ